MTACRQCAEGILQHPQEAVCQHYTLCICACVCVCGVGARLNINIPFEQKIMDIIYSVSVGFGHAGGYCCIIH